MKLPTVMFVFSFALAATAPAAMSESVLGGIEKGMKGLERKLCKVSPSEKCNRKKVSSLKTKGTEVAPPVKKPVALQPRVERPASPKVVPVPQPRPDKLNTAPPEVHAIPVPRLKPLPPQTQPLPPAAPLQPPPAKATSLPPTAVPPKPPVQPDVVPNVPSDEGDCLAALMKAGISFSPVPQPGSGAECLVANPVRVNAIATKFGSIKLPDQPTLNCAFASKFGSWVQTVVQPLAQSSQGAAISAMGTGPGFDCRGRRGDASSKISEHAKGNAVDIVMMRLVNSSQVQVKDAVNPQAVGFGFLRDLRAAACASFTTVLGPGANPAHAEHFHIDLEQRKGGYRICE